MQSEPSAPGKTKQCKQQDESSECAFDQKFRTFLQQNEAEWNSNEGGKNEPDCASQMNMAPVLCNDHYCNSDRNQYGKRSRHLHRHEKREQGNRNQRFAKTEGRANQRCNENDDENGDEA